jgi:ubiquinone/menaquinone biosynthesis C-methylase UbiE
MGLRTFIYRRLNRLFGTPQKVEAGKYARTEEIFTAHTIPFLKSQQAHFKGRVLVVGCGTGVEAQWIAGKADSVLAVDVHEESLKKARERTKDLGNMDVRLLEDKLPCDDASIDVIFMHDVCEHIIDLDHWFAEYHRVLKPGGVFINQFSPLFYSPFGAHLVDALKMPWGHLVFGVKAVTNLRNDVYSGHLEANSWADLGLNRLTERRYLKMVKKVGFGHKNYQYKTSMNMPFGRIPFLKNLFILQITDTLEKS